MRKKKRKIAVICSSRATYGYKRKIIGLLTKSAKIDLQLIVTGTHLMENYGYSVKDIEADGYPISVRLPMTVANDTPMAWVRALGDQMSNLAQVFEQLKPDMVLVTGDRAEMFIAAAAAAYMNIPVAHVQAGDVSGHIDGVIRHAITKLAHIHFPSCDDSAERVRKLGEEDWRIFVVGAPQLDDIAHGRKMSKGELQKIFGFNFNQPVILLIFHPVLAEYKEAEWQMNNIMKAVKEIGEQTIIIFPSIDAGNYKIIEVAKKYAKFPFIKTFFNLNRLIFISLMANSTVLLGNSSAGILEAPSLKLAAVNIGNRQRGRMQVENVINVGYNKKDIKKGIQKAMVNKGFKVKLAKCTNPYGDGHSSQRIVRVLENIRINKKLLDKKIIY